MPEITFAIVLTKAHAIKDETECIRQALIADGITDVDPAMQEVLAILHELPQRIALFKRLEELNR